jgi:hypothetical protein
MADGTPNPGKVGFWWTAAAAFVGVIGGQAVVGMARAAYASAMNRNAPK